MKLLRILALSALVIGAYGCSPKEEAVEPVVEETTTSQTEESVPEQELVVYTNEEGEALCPVMENAVPDTEAAVGYQDHEGVRYYFCCTGCPEQFAANPEQYIKTEDN